MYSFKKLKRGRLMLSVAPLLCIASSMNVSATESDYIVGTRYTGGITVIDSARVNQLCADNNGCKIKISEYSEMSGDRWLVAVSEKDFSTEQHSQFSNVASAHFSPSRDRDEAREGIYTFTNSNKPDSTLALDHFNFDSSNSDSIISDMVVTESGRCVFSDADTFPATKPTYYDHTVWVNHGDYDNTDGRQDITPNYSIMESAMVKVKETVSLAGWRVKEIFMAQEDDARGWCVVTIQD